MKKFLIFLSLSLIAAVATPIVSYAGPTDIYAGETDIGDRTKDLVVMEDETCPILINYEPVDIIVMEVPKAAPMANEGKAVTSFIPANQVADNSYALHTRTLHYKFLKWRQFTNYYNHYTEGKTNGKYNPTYLRRISRRNE